MNGESTEHRVSGVEGTHAVAAALASRLRPGDAIALHGELGAGKTTFVQGLGLALHVREPVTSPTFTLINEYRGDLTLYHVDLYRLAGEAEAEDAGVGDCLAGGGVTLVEWAERAAGLLPAGAIHVEIRPGDGAESRVIRIRRGGSA
jgi:tRNA threonylcarbamoyladenosine biosynthesis protein TsaE